MPRYRRRDAEVDAEQFDGTRECADHLIGSHRGGIWKISSLTKDDPRILKVRVENGVANLFPGDWIVTTSDEKIHICRSYDFDKTYEPVEG